MNRTRSPTLMITFLGFAPAAVIVIVDVATGGPDGCVGGEEPPQAAVARVAVSKIRRRNGPDGNRIPYESYRVRPNDGAAMALLDDDAALQSGVGRLAVIVEPTSPRGVERKSQPRLRRLQQADRC